MAKDNPVHWTVEDEVVLINFLLLHTAAAGDGSNFKMVTFNAAAPVIDMKQAKGGPKAANSCQNKYNSVYPTILFMFNCAEMTIVALLNLLCHTGDQE